MSAWLAQPEGSYFVIGGQVATCDLAPGNERDDSTGEVLVEAGQVERSTSSPVLAALRRHHIDLRSGTLRDSDSPSGTQRAREGRGAS